MRASVHSSIAGVVENDLLTGIGTNPPGSWDNIRYLFN